MLKQNVEQLCEERGWSLRRLACNMNIKKHRLERVLSGNFDLDVVQRIADAFEVPVLKVLRRAPANKAKQSTRCGYTVNEDGSLNWG